MATVRERRAARALALRNEGLKLREIAGRMGVAITTVDGWLHDPDGSRMRARKDSYRGVCESCGGPTDGSNGHGAAPRSCQGCLEWSDEEIIEAIRQWAADHAGTPPRSTDWRRRTDSHPCDGVVSRRFGWPEALIMAGFTPYLDRRAETQAEIERLVSEGRPVAEIAERFGCTTNNIYQRLAYRGLTVKALRVAA